MRPSPWVIGRPSLCLVESSGCRRGAVFVAELILLLVAAGVRPLLAANPGDEVIVIYNSRMAESKALAYYYAEHRHVPAKQVFGFALPVVEDISRSEFRNALQLPLAKKLESERLWHVGPQHFAATTNQPALTRRAVVQSKIRFALLCYGVPLRIAPAPELKEEAAEKLRPEMRRNEAAVDSELALLPLLEENLPLAGPLRNPVFSATNSTTLHPTNGVLMVTRLDGPTSGIAQRLVDKALVAETDGLWGRAYFDLRNTSDPGFKLGDNWIRNASEISRRLGYETIVDENPGTFPAGFPMSQIALYLGWYTQDISGPLAQPTVEFMPGAFAYHLHSFSAASLRSTNRNWVGPLLAKGATISMGCVNEPYLSGTPDVGVFVARLLYYGLTFGEAAYASQPVLSWQTTVVGDPLYRPAGQNPEQLHHDLESRHSPLVEWSYLRWANINLANGKPIAEWVTFLEQLELTRKSAVLTEKLGDLYADQGKPDSASHAYAQALKLEPSPQQRVRLLLSLGEKLVGLDRAQEAYEAYQQLLQEFPSYPDRLGVCRKLLPLAQQLHKQEEAEKLEIEIKRLAPGEKS
jgi:uncharacterized protein (TIGR03790 family)